MNYTGHLRLRATEHEHCERCSMDYVFECSDETLLEDVGNSSHAPINELVTVEIDANCIVSWDWVSDRRPAQMVDTRRKDIALVRILPSNHEITDSDRLRIRLEARELEDFFKQVNDGQWDSVRVTHYVVNNYDGGGYGLNYPWDRVRDQMEEQHPGRFNEHNYFHGWGGHKSGILGLAYVGTPHAHTFGGGIRTVKHEQGHCFGCRHSTTASDPYGDQTCVMAKANCGFNAPQMVALNRIPSTELVDAESERTVYLLPAECSQIDMRHGECRAARLGPYILSTRKTNDQSRLGVNSMDYNPSESVVYVHYAPYHRINHPEYRTKIQPQESVEIDQFVIKNDSVHEGVIRVTIGNIQ